MVGSEDQRRPIAVNLPAGRDAPFYPLPPPTVQGLGPRTRPPRRARRPVASAREVRYDRARVTPGRRVRGRGRSRGSASDGGCRVQYVIWGWAVAVDPEGRVVDDPAILDELAGFIDEEDLYATDYIGDTPPEDAIAAALERSGQLRFALKAGEASLRVFTTFVSRRPLTSEELDWLRYYVLGQWSDGMGESLFVPSGPFENYQLQPLGEHEVEATGYPFVEALEGDAQALTRDCP